MNQQPNRDLQWPENAWRLHLQLDMPALESEVIEYAVFSADPFLQFASDKQRVGDVFQKQLEDVAEPARRETLKRMQLVSLWNRLFRMVRGDEVYVLRNGYSGLAHMSNAPAGKRWLVTKPVLASEIPVYWCVPFEVEPGKDARVELTATNARPIAQLETKAS